MAQGNGVELGTAYLTLAAETSSLLSGLGKSLAQGEKLADDSGKRMGQNLKKGIDSAQPMDIGKLTQKVEADQKRLSATVEQTSRKEEDARRKVEIAEQRLKETREKSTSTASQVMRAEDQLRQAQNKLKDATADSEAKYELFSKQLEKSKGDLAEAEKHNKDLARAMEQSAREAEDAKQKYSGFTGAIRKGLAGAKGAVKTSLDGAFKPVEKEAKSSGERAGNSFTSSLKGSLAGVGAYFGAQEIFGGIADSVKSAGQLEQSIGAVDSVFKGSAGQMHEWAKTADTTVGLSENSYNEFASVLGASLKNAGTPMEQLGGKTNDLIGLGADLASMYGGTTAEAIDAVSSALRGEMDPIERYGISLNENALNAEAMALGIEKTGGAFTNQQKQLLVQSLLMKQSADAQGNFARETDTFAGKQAIATAQFENLKTQLGTAFLPMLTNVMSFISTNVIPGFESFGGAIKRVADFFAPVVNFLIQTSPYWSPFAIGIGLVATAYGVWAGATWAVTTASGALAGVMAFLTSPITLTIASIGLLVGALIYAYNHFDWFKNGVQAVWSWVQLATQNVVTWFQTVALPFLVAVLQQIGGWFSWLYTNAIKPAFDFALMVIQGFINWLTTVAIPWVQSAIGVIGSVFSWLYQNIVKPVFNGIMIAITVALTLVKMAFDACAWVVRNVLAPVFTWLYYNIVKPVFDWVVARISSFVGWFQNTAVPLIKFAIEALKFAFHLLWQTVSNVWNWISSKISASWAWIRDVVLRPLAIFLDATVGEAFRALWRTTSGVWDWIKNKLFQGWEWVRVNVLRPFREGLNTLKDAFERTKDGIGDAWDKLKEKTKTPIKWVVDHVVNKFINGYNDMNDFWSGSNLEPIKGFARGGILPGYQSRKKDELLTPMRKGEGVLVPEAVRALGSDFIHGINGSANNGGISGARAWLKNRKDGRASGDAHGHNHGASAGAYGWSGSSFKTSGATPPSGGNGIWGSFQASASRAGAMSFPDKNFMGVSTKRAAQAWMGRSALNVNTDGKGPGVSVGYGSQGPWGFNSGSSVQVNPSAPGNMVLSILMHEFGHALSLDHTNNGASLMHPAIAGVRSPSASDYSALVSAWGKPGEGVKTYDVNGGDGGGILGFLAEKLTDPVRALIGKGKDLFKGNNFVEMPLGIADKMLEQAVAWISEKHGGASDGASGADWTSTIKDALKRTGLPVRDDYINAWKRQIQTESGGNPRAVQGAIGDINNLTGDVAKGLVQVIGSTFASYRDPSLPDDRFNPLANLVAGMRYAKARYGTSGLLGAIGQGHGYALGGIVGETPKLYDQGGLISGKGLRLIDHQRSTPDYVLTNRQWDAMYKIAEQSQSTSHGNNISITVPEREGIDPTTMGRRISESFAWELSKAGI